MTDFFSREPLTRGERTGSLIVQVFSFGVCAFGVWACLQPHRNVGVFVCTTLAFASGVGLRVRRKIANREDDDD